MNLITYAELYLLFNVSRGTLHTICRQSNKAIANQSVSRETNKDRDRFDRCLYYTVNNQKYTKYILHLYNICYK